MNIKCINYNCPIVKQYGQICTTLYHGDLTNKRKNNITLENIKPNQNENGNYYCYQFGD
jgi:hypothetical protein